jgi:hypothetical protein
MEAERHVKGAISRSLEENNHHFNEVREWLEKWVEDMVLAEEKELKDTKQQINFLKSAVAPGFHDGRTA